MKYFMKYLFEHGFIVLDDALFDMAFIFYYYLIFVSRKHGLIIYTMLYKYSSFIFYWLPLKKLLIISWVAKMLVWALKAASVKCNSTKNKWCKKKAKQKKKEWKVSSGESVHICQQQWYMYFAYALTNHITVIMSINTCTLVSLSFVKFQGWSSLKRPSLAYNTTFIEKRACGGVNDR